MAKQNLTQQKHTFTNKKCTTTQNKHKKLKPGLVASYDIRPGNGEGLFWLWHFINLPLVLRHLPAYLQSPGHTHGAERVKTNHQVQYVGQRSFHSKVIVHTHTHTHTQTHTHSLLYLDHSIR